MKFLYKKDLNPVTKGFTLVELLIVISILGILSAFTLSIINTRTQRARAEDAVRQATVSKLGQIMDAFNVAEGFYPGSVYPSGNPLGTGASPGPSRTINCDCYHGNFSRCCYNSYKPPRYQSKNKRRCKERRSKKDSIGFRELFYGLSGLSRNNYMG